MPGIGAFTGITGQGSLERLNNVIHKLNMSNRLGQNMTSRLKQNWKPIKIFNSKSLHWQKEPSPPPCELSLFYLFFEWTKHIKESTVLRKGSACRVFLLMLQTMKQTKMKSNKPSEKRWKGLESYYIIAENEDKRKKMTKKSLQHGIPSWLPVQVLTAPNRA